MVDVKNAGKAYGFFDCDHPRNRIEKYLPEVCDYAKTPDELDLSLVEGVDNIRGDKDLMALAQEARKQGMNYILEATFPNQTNRRTGHEVAAVLNQVYQSPLFEEGDPFMGETVFEERGRYITID